MKLSIYFALLAVIAFAQTEPVPSFQPDRVLFIDHPVPLAPGLILSIFGNNLGPTRGCASFHDAKGIYPKQLCDTQVLVGGIPSELLWVQASQINLGFLPRRQWKAPRIWWWSIKDAPAKR